MRQLFLWVALGGVVAAAFAAGPAPPPPAAAARPLTVVAAFYPLYVTALNVVGEAPGVRVLNLAPPAAGCAEHYQLTPADLRTLGAADVLVINGAGLETYAEKLAAQFPRLVVVNASAGLPLLEHHGEPNAHVWVSPALAARQAGRVAAELAKADPARAALYQRNAAAYAARLEALAGRMREELARAPARRVVVFHDGLPYLARDLQLEIVATVEPALGQQPSAGRLAEVVAKVRGAGGPVVLLAESGTANPAALVLRQELKTPLYHFDLATAGPLDPAGARDAYVRAMESNLAMLCAAFKISPAKGA